MAKSSASKDRPFSNRVVRTSTGLREALFDEIDGLRSGDSTPTRANAVAKLSDQIVNTVQMEINVQRFASSVADTITTPGLPKPLKLTE